MTEGNTATRAPGRVGTDRRFPAQRSRACLACLAAAPPTDRPTDKRALRGIERNSKDGSDQARTVTGMRRTTQVERKVCHQWYGDMHWASPVAPVPDTRGVRQATRTVNAKRNGAVWGSMLLFFLESAFID